MNKGISIFVSASFLLFCSCEKLSKATTTNNSSDNSIQISGTAQLGPIKNATVSVYLINPDGSRGSLVTSTTTDSVGAYVFSMLPNLGEFMVVISGGSYTEESGGATVDMEGRELLAVFPAISAAMETSVTPLTHIAYQRAASLRNSGIPIAEAIEVAKQEVAQAAGLSNIDIPPANPEASLDGELEEARKYALFLAGLSQMAADSGINSFEAANAFGNDFHNDGQFNGSDDGTDILLGSSGQYLGNDDWSNDLDQAMNDYLLSPDNTAGFIVGDVTVPIDDALIDIPPPSLDSISPDPSIPMFFGLQGPIPMPVGVCVPVDLLILDQYMRIAPLQEDAMLVNMIPFDPYLAQLFTDPSCSMEITSAFPLQAGESIVPLFVRANSAGYLDFHNYQIDSLSGAQAPLYYLGDNTIFADPFAPGSMVPISFELVGATSISVSSCEAYQVIFFDSIGNPVQLYNGGELIDMFPQPGVYEFHMDPSCSSPVSSVVPIPPGGLGTIYIKGIGAGSFDLFNLNLFSYGSTATMPLAPIGNTFISVF